MAEMDKFLIPSQLAVGHDHSHTSASYDGVVMVKFKEYLTLADAHVPLEDECIDIIGSKGIGALISLAEYSSL